MIRMSGGISSMPSRANTLSSSIRSRDTTAESRERELPREAFLGLRPRDFGMATKIRCSTDKTGPERELPPCLSAQWPTP